MQDGRKNNGGARFGAGRKKGVKNGNTISALIAKECEKLVNKLSQDPAFQRKMLFENLPTNEPKSEYFYIIKAASGICKIGYTGSLNSRMSAYQTHGGAMSLEFLFKSAHAFKIESIVISKFCDGSEWVYLSDIDIKEIKRICHELELGRSFFNRAKGELDLLNQV